MPLQKGKSRKVMEENLHELEHSTSSAGKKRTHKQNVAIMLAEARKSGKKNSRERK